MMFAIYDVSLRSKVFTMCLYHSMSRFLAVSIGLLTPCIQKSDQTLGEVMVIFPITMAMLGCPLFMGLIPFPLFSSSVPHFFSKINSGYEGLTVSLHVCMRVTTRIVIYIYRDIHIYIDI